MTISKTYRRELATVRTVATFTEKHPAIFNALLIGEVLATVAAAVINF